MMFTIPIAGFILGVALAGCVNADKHQNSTMSPGNAGYPSVDASFLSAMNNLQHFSKRC